MCKQFEWMWRTVATLLLAVGVVVGTVSAQGISSEGVAVETGQPWQVEAPNANDYLWIAGGAFKPRSTSTEYLDTGNGCIASSTGGSSLNESFTVPFRLPNNSVLIGVRFYYYDAAVGSSRLSITSYDGAGNYTDHVLVTSVGSSGYDNVYQGLTTPYTLDTYSRGFVLNWYPDVAGSSMRLCGARVFYDAGTAAAVIPQHQPVPAHPTTGVDADEANTALASDYYFLAGSSFERVDAGIQYMYGTSGCMYATTAYNALTIDLNIPDGATLSGARFYFNDIDPTNDIGVYLVDYTGLGGTRTLLQGSSSGSGGYSSIYKAISPSYSPYVVDQFTYALNAVVTGSRDASRQICGVRVFYVLPSAQPLQRSEPTVAMSPASAGLNSPDALSGGFTTNLQLPQSAVISGVRLYYKATQLPVGSATLRLFNGISASSLGYVEAIPQAGYGSNYAALNAPYTVDYFTGTPGLVANVVQSQQYSFCGARIFYTAGGATRYRFVAGSSFHPLDSSAVFDYHSPGCIDFRYDGSDIIFRDGFE